MLGIGYLKLVQILLITNELHPRRLVHGLRHLHEALLLQHLEGVVGIDGLEAVGFGKQAKVEVEGYQLAAAHGRARVVGQRLVHAAHHIGRRVGQGGLAAQAVSIGRAAE